ncbi:peptidyl tRNA hydrolase [Mycobacterium phage Adlitam]|nr:peptidyl tRNA hydrolase [Mycobacterium phage Adlitam]
MTNPQAPDKFYIAVRGDLPPGLQLAQSVHAMAEFWDQHPTFARSWRHRSNFLVVVSVPDEEALLALASEAAIGKGLCTTLVCEPDLGDEHTALAIQPGPAAATLCASFKLALRNAVDMDREVVG